MPTTITSAGITFNDATTQTTAFSSLVQKQIAKAWVNFDGTTSPGTIRSSYNVSSITKNGTGDYTVNFATPMADANYSVSGSSINPSGIITLCISPLSSPTASSVRIETLRTSPLGGVDSTNVSVQIFGN